MMQFHFGLFAGFCSGWCSSRELWSSPVGAPPGGGLQVGLWLLLNFELFGSLHTARSEVRACLRHCAHLSVLLHILGWVHTCNITVYRNTVSWQCGRDSWPRKVSKVGYAVKLRACSVCCRYLAVASNGWYGYGQSRCGRPTWRCTSTPAPAVTLSSVWCDGQIPTAHRTSP